MERVQLVFHGGQEVLSAFIPKALFDNVRKRAKREGVSYKRYIRHVLERAVSEPRTR